MNPQLWWYLARAGGIVAWGLLTLTVIWGLLLRTTLTPSAARQSLVELHRFLSGLAVAFTVVHVAGLLLDDYVQLDVADLLVPFASSWRPLPVALGTLALYVLGAVVVTSVQMHRMPRRWWHAVHLTSYLLFWLATMHAVTAGTDARNTAMVLTVNVAIAVVLFLVLVRILTRTPAAPPRLMSAASRQSYPLTIAHVRRETADAVSVVFDVPQQLAAAFRFQPGQHVTVRACIDGMDVRRPYSISSGVTDGDLRIAVKRVPEGRMSDWLNTAARPGDVLDVTPPTGRFTTDLDPRRARRLLAVAAGSGITPVYSIISSVLAHEPDSRCTLLYGNRTTEQILLYEELSRLQDCFGPRLLVLHALTREPERPAALHGRITARTIRQLSEPLELATIDDAFLCGPPALSAEIRAELLRLGVRSDRVHVEHFTPSTSGTLAATTGQTSYTVTIVHAGTATTVRAEPGETVLDSGLRAGLELPYSCRSGICGTCRARIARGQTDGGIGVAGADPSSSAVLACQARPLSDDVVVDFDMISPLRLPDELEVP